MHRTVIAIDVGGTKISGGIVSDCGDIKFFRRESTNKEGGYRVVDQIICMIKSLLALVEGSKYIAGIGISVPAAVNNNVIIMAPNIRGWENLPIAELIKSRLGVDIPVIVIDDRVAVALGECWLGVARGKKNVVVITIGTGLGAGIIINGQPYFGSTGVAGAIGWWITDREELDRRTEKGFLEEKIAGPAIAQKAITVLKGEKQKTETLLLDLCRGNLDNITSEMVFEAAQKGDSFAKRIIKEVAVSLGIAISNIVSILNPEIIVITGSVGKALIDSSRIIKGIVEKFSQPYAAKNVEIVFSELGHYAYLLGVAKYTLDITLGK